jgi:hypothetical protein
MIGSETASIRRRSIVLAAIAGAVATILAIGLAASRSVAAGAETAPSPHATEYLPSISDLMIATIQPRHERLWRAGQDETGNLQPTSLEISAAHSIASGTPIQSHTTSPFPT